MKAMPTLSNYSYVPASKTWTETQKTLAIFIVVLIDLSAVICNSLILLTVVLKKAVRNRSDSVLVANLALSDLLVACFVMPFSADTLLHDRLRFGETVATFIGFGNFTFCIASIINLTILAANQCLTIKWPFRYRSLRPTSSPKCATAFVWMYSCCCAIPPLFGVSSYMCFIPNTGLCTDKEWAGSADAVIFTILVTSLSWGLGVIILILSYAQIYLIVLKQRKAVSLTMVHTIDCPLNINLKKDELKPPSAFETLELCSHAEESQQELKPSHGNSKTFKVKESYDCKKQDIYSCVRECSIQEMTTSASPRREGRKQHERKRCKCFPDTKPAISLLIIVFVYFISWSPFCIVLLIEIVQKKKQYDQLSLIFLWIGHSSSVLNPALYFYRFPMLRRATLELFFKSTSRSVGVI